MTNSASRKMPSQRRQRFRMVQLVLRLRGTERFVLYILRIASAASAFDGNSAASPIPLVLKMSLPGPPGEFPVRGPSHEGANFAGRHPGLNLVEVLIMRVGQGWIDFAQGGPNYAAEPRISQVPLQQAEDAGAYQRTHKPLRVDGSRRLRARQKRLS